MLFLGIEESERIHHDGCAGASGLKGQSPHVPSDPSDSSATLGSEQSRAIQESDSEVEAGDVSPAFRKGQRMPPMSATDIEDATRR